MTRQLDARQLACAADLLDVIEAAAHGDHDVGGAYVGGLTLDGLRYALSLAIGISGGAVSLLANHADLDVDIIVSHMRRRATE